MSHNPDIPEEPGQLDLFNDQIKTFLDCLENADCLELDHWFVGRNFTIHHDVDDEVDPIVLEIHTIMNDNWYFSQNECEEAKYKGDGVWILPLLNGSGEEDGTFEIVLYNLSKVIP